MRGPIVQVLLSAHDGIHIAHVKCQIAPEVVAHVEGHDVFDECHVAQTAGLYRGSAGHIDVGCL